MLLVFINSACVRARMEILPAEPVDTVDIRLLLPCNKRKVVIIIIIVITIINVSVICNVPGVIDPAGSKLPGVLDNTDFRPVSIFNRLILDKTNQSCVGELF
jgi:hypothetical protein